MNRRTFLATSAAAACTLAGLPTFAHLRTGSRGRRPLNVLVIVLDTVRGDRFVQSPSITPEYDRLAARGVRFDRAWAPTSWSLPSHATILTGRYPHEHRADWPDLRLSRQFPSIASFLESRGYVTGAFSSNSAWVTPEYMNAGFHRFRAYTLEDHIRRTTWGRAGNGVARMLGLHEAGRGRRAPEVHEEFLDFIGRYKDRPFFGYVCHMDANQAFHHARLNRPFWRADPPVSEVLDAYHAGIRTLDGHLGQLMDELSVRGILDRTLVVVTSDHGESFGIANAGDHDPPGHGSSLYPEQTRVPLAVIMPDDRNAGRVVSGTVGIRSIPATIATLLGIGHPFPGPVLPMNPDRESEPASAVVAQSLNYNELKTRALVTDHWLFLQDRKTGIERLYDMVNDPTCQEDLAERHDAVRTLRETLERELPCSDG